MTLLTYYATPHIRILERADSPSLPDSGEQFVYCKSDGFWYVMDDSGSESLVQTGTLDAAYIGFSPTDMTYWADEADPGSVEDALGQLVARIYILENPV